MSALPPKANILGPPKRKGPAQWPVSPPLLASLVSLSAAAGIRRCELQISFDRVIADRYVNQCSTLKSRDEFVVFDRIDSDATGGRAAGHRQSDGVPTPIPRHLRGECLQAAANTRAARLRGKPHRSQATRQHPAVSCCALADRENSSAST